ncbi:hypothetical protein U9R90_08330 [Streptomyces sp. E11-3]|uniref:hypothetical protein n=1 Tax=Streptomyces sp. E11-3 TaxID=3110112 RepID=UPI0039818C89
MGVFSRFRRKSKDTEEASTAEAQAATLTVEPAAEAAEEAVEASAEAAADGDDVPDTDADAASAEGVEIPKQQSADEAADNEAGEAARK